MDDFFEPMLADYYTMAMLELPKGIAVVVKVMADGGQRYLHDNDSLEPVVATPEHPYGDPNVGPIASRPAFVDGAVDQNVAGRWIKI